MVLQNHSGLFRHILTLTSNNPLSYRATQAPLLFTIVAHQFHLRLRIVRAPARKPATRENPGRFIILIRHLFQYSGDEFANTQGGNNNAYCQDNEISWLDWNRLETRRDLYDYVRRLIAFRKAHPVLRADSYDFSPNGTGYPALSFHGTQPWALDGQAPGLSFAYLYAEDHAGYGTDRDAFIYVAVNAWWEEQRYTLPVLPEGCRWKLAFDSCGVSADPGSELPLEDQSGITLGPRSTAILVGNGDERCQ